MSIVNKAIKMVSKYCFKKTFAKGAATALSTTIKAAGVGSVATGAYYAKSKIKYKFDKARTEDKIHNYMELKSLNNTEEDRFKRIKIAVPMNKTSIKKIN